MNRSIPTTLAVAAALAAATPATTVHAASWNDTATHAPAPYDRDHPTRNDPPTRTFRTRLAASLYIDIVGGPGHVRIHASCRRTDLILHGHGLHGPYHLRRRCTVTLTATATTRRPIHAYPALVG